jgi:two-component system LytT family response regulator
MKQYRAIIIDDESSNRAVLALLLNRYCKEIEIVGSTGSADEGRELLNIHTVDIIFLDIAMPREDGFDFLATIQKENYSIIFVTAFHDFALRALKASAIDYLLKPVNYLELQEAVSKAIRHHEFRKKKESEKNIYQESLNILNENIQSGTKSICKITVAEQFGFKLVNVADIMYLEADGNYTILHLSGFNKIVASRTMGDFEKILDSPEFFRIHKSTMINLDYLNAYTSYNGDYAELTDGTKLSISRRKMTEFLSAVSNVAKRLK